MSEAEIGLLIMGSIAICTVAAVAVYLLWCRLRDDGGVRRW